MTGKASVSPRRIGRALLLVAAAAGIALAARDPAIGWLVPVTVGGGALTAAALLAARSHRSQTIALPDRFADEAPIGVMNVSRVRAAGIGGLGLVIVAIVVALQYPLTTAAVVAGVGGGAVGALAVILYRRR
jgi:hypothetical protein